MAERMPRTIAERIDGAFDELTPQERRVAEFVLDHPGELAVYNDSELARMAGVSKATVSRLYRRLGFSGSAEVRDHVRALRSSGTPLGHAGVPATAPEGVSAVLEAERANLSRLLDGLADGVLERVATLLREARTVLVVGYRNGYPVALHLREQLAQCRPGVRIGPQPGQSIGEELADLGPGDVAVLVGLRRRPAGFAELVAAAAETGAEVVAIVDPAGADAAGAAGTVIACPVDGAGAFSSYASAMSLVSLVASAVLAGGLRAGRTRIARIDDAYARLGEVEASG
ncbi:rpiR family transcriptional regulator [Agromyces rhizosphaerae]|uniref:RpiR family transcriptional regulator n=1 Tax=Agromyces rhizosphaerae TaxID=88374 RepID=A0A9W6CTD3_9MICO|nr:MurR/RpiR family transcriptional regulator [Agromyces rhizosphaerae]GLI28138.1 rpiR family transcriptional regulator [Agromyces rhizosphaerae]